MRFPQLGGDLAGAAFGLLSPPMAQTARSTDLAKPPEEVFPYLFDDDKVPQWTTGLERYERLDSGPLGRGSRFREALEVSGQRIDGELEITAYDPPHSAESRTEVRGVDIVFAYELSPTAQARASPSPSRRRAAG